MEVIVIVIILITIVAIIDLIYDSRQQKKELDSKGDWQIHKAQEEVRKKIHDGKYKEWCRYKDFKEKSDTYQSTVVFNIEQVQESDKYVYHLYLESLEELNKAKTAYQKDKEFKEKENRRRRRWGQPILYFENKPDESYLKELLDFKEKIRYMLQAYSRLVNSPVGETYNWYADDVTKSLNFLADWQVSLYESFGLDDNAQGIELRKVLNIKLPKVTDAFGDVKNDFSWFPYPEMDRAYFED